MNICYCLVKKWRTYKIGKAQKIDTGFRWYCFLQKYNQHEHAVCGNSAFVLQWRNFGIEHPNYLAGIGKL